MFIPYVRAFQRRNALAICAFEQQNRPSAQRLARVCQRDLVLTLPIQAHSLYVRSTTACRNRCMLHFTHKLAYTLVEISPITSIYTHVGSAVHVSYHQYTQNASKHTTSMKGLKHDHPKLDINSRHTPLASPLLFKLPAC